MIPDRTQLGTLYIKTDNGEYQELGKTTSVDYSCAVDELPTLNLELHCTYEKSKKEKEEKKKMTYEELVKTLPEIKIKGKKIEYNKTRVTCIIDGTETNGVIIYNDGCNAMNLIIRLDSNTGSNDLSDISTYYMDDFGITDILLTRFSDNNKYRWVNESDLKIVEETPYTETLFNENGITLTSKGKNLFEACNQAIDTKEWIIDPVWQPFHYGVDFGYENKKCEEKEEGNKMKLIEIYKEKSFNNINKYYEKALKEHKESDAIYRAYTDIINETNNKLKALYNSQDFTKDNLYMLEDDSDYVESIEYSLTYNGEDEYTRKMNEEKNNLIDSIDEMINEVYAQIECIEKCHGEFSYAAIMRTLKEYGIVDEKGKVTPFTMSKKSETSINTTKKRGRKPTKKSE